MKKNILKLINACLIITFLGASVFFFSEHEKDIHPWLPFYNQIGSKPPSAPLNLPIDLSAAQLNVDNTEGLSGIPVLLYHGILEKIVPNDISNTSIRVFEAQMKMLRDEGYTSINTRDLYGIVTDKKKLPPKPILITFDDGRIDSVKNGDPILEKYGFKAVMFDVAGKQNSNDKFFLSWSDLQNMYKSGRWDIEVHGGDHYHTSVTIDQFGKTGYFASNKEWLSQEGRLETDEEYGQRLISDIKKAKSDLEQHLPGINLVSFAFPYGDYGENAVNIDANLAIQKNHDAIDDIFPISFGFDGSYVPEKAFNFFYYKGADPHLIQRLDVKDSLTAEELKNALSIYENKNIPFSVDKFDGGLLENILSIWSKSSLSEGGLFMKASADTEGSQATVTGTNYWLNYKLESDITLEAGSTGFLVSRYKDSDNYLLCGVDGSDISFRQVVGGKDMPIKSTPFIKYQGKDFHISVEATGDVASCSVNGETVGHWRIDPALNMGEIGFKAWDPEKGKSVMTVHNIHVTNSKPITIGYSNDLPVNNLTDLIKNDAAYLDVISPAWYRLDGQGAIIADEWKMGEIKTNVGKSTSIFPSISDWSLGMNGANQSVIHSILSNGAAKNNAAENIIRLMTDKGYTGINLDIENISLNDKNPYSDFIKILAEKMHTHNFVLVVNVPVKTGKDDSSWSEGFDYKKIGQYADLIVLMAYNKNNLSTAPGPIAPCSWTEAVAQYAISNIAASKIILGVPAYGYDWMEKNGKYTGGQSVPVNLSFNAESLQDQKPIKETADGSEYQYTDAAKNIHHVWIENELSLSCRLDQLNKLKLSGLSLWSIGQEPDYYWKILQGK
jgi:spore germination protein YaaH/peptidoglycan/xylan/chitin deacetylase (PgdA/CDA1 family)